MKLKEFLAEASDVAQLPRNLKTLFTKAGWSVQKDNNFPDSASFTARFSGEPEKVLAELTKGIAYLELHDMTWGARTEGTAIYEVRGDGKTFFAEVRFWSIKRKPTAQISFYEG